MAKSIYEGEDVVRHSGIHIKNDTPETRKTDLGKLSGRVKVVKYDGTGGGTTTYNADTKNSISGLITKELNKQFAKKDE